MATFQQISAIIEPSFWHALSQKKLNDMMLDERPFESVAYFQCGRSQGISSFLFLNEESLSETQQDKLYSHYLNYTAKLPIQITLVNTKNNFLSLDRAGILKSLSDSIFQAIETRSWLEQPSLLLKSALTVFGDLKKWHFLFCFAFPTPSIKSITIAEKEEFQDEFENYPDWAFALNSEGKPIKLSEANSESTFVIIDPSTCDDLGWPALIFSLAVAKTFNLSKFKLIRLNYKPFKCEVNVPELLTADTKFTGWKLNKKKPFFVDLSSTMDPLSLFSSASYLNLRLMKWRMSPRLDVDQIRLKKALLIGCGTLGCNVARDLLGWGVRNFTLIDYGKVSYSNPPRQPLFCFNDCLNGGRPKSEAAADELKRVCPDVSVQFDSFEIPMPGHHTTQESFPKLKENVEKLDKLIQEHDVTFLLTDTRESRWLPTVIGVARHKLCISIALGYDTFSVVRSGSKNVGCYFCNDIVAPVDSMTDRTLDMQCTVTRPGIAPLASAVGVELWAAVTQHPDGLDAHGDTESILGGVPHQIRGFLHSWQVLPMTGDSFKCCVGCSEKVVNGYLEQGAEFVMRAVNEPNFLEDVSGITEMKATMVDEDCEWIDDD
ncbi:ThiF family protein [Tritrichomonas foetus]|uniref:ThiF family protein n=1 Tax=Tritrichomonas foetus TaxID=1144522 RepID=A0A1J4JH64_9EUKA|nr:ThiF family protein [Tritrichomonas foetus]|eukprot:OHS96604.1 ThiF family protein [Tritrichomonas foetus]